MVHAVPCALLLCFGVALQQAHVALAFRRHARDGGARNALQTESHALSEIEIADTFRTLARGKTKGGKGGKSGQGGVMGFFQKMLIKNAANQVFKPFDRDRNGHLDARELNEALGSVTRWVGINPSPSMISQALMMFDCDGSGTLDQYEFYLMVRQLHFLVSGGTGKHYKLMGMTLNGCHGHRPHGFMPLAPGFGHGGGYNHGHNYRPGHSYGPGYGPQPGYGPSPGYGPHPGFGPSPGYGPHSGY
jgi:hypothetical protein